MTDTLKYPFTFEELNDEEEKLVQICFDKEIVRVSGTKFTLVDTIKKYGEEIYNFKPRPDDVWLIGFPRSGTTMMQEILYILGTDLDYQKAASTVMDYRFPYLENALMRVFGNPDIIGEIQEKPEEKEKQECIPPHIRLTDVKEQRFIKSHLNFKFLHPNLLDAGCKVVFMARNIKDCFVSNYYFPLKGAAELRGENHMLELLQCYKKHLYQWGNYFEGLKEAWENRNNKNLLILFYEEVIEDKKAAIKKVSAFLGKTLTESQLEKLVDHVSMENFRKNRSVNNEHLVQNGIFLKNENFRFIRNGGSGGWREKFTKEMNDLFNDIIRENFKEIPGFQMPECWKKAMDL